MGVLPHSRKGFKLRHWPATAWGGNIAANAAVADAPFVPASQAGVLVQSELDPTSLF